MADGYTAVLPALRSLAQDTEAHGRTAGALADRLRGLSLPADAFGRLPSSGAANTRTREDVTRAADHIRAQVDSFGRAVQGVNTAAAGYQTCDTQTAQANSQLQACLPAR